MPIELNVEAGASFFGYMEKQIAQLQRYGQFRTAETYSSALNSFRRFREEADLPLEELSCDVLSEYEFHLKRSGVTPNTVVFYLKRLRAVYNKAVGDELIEDRHPFRKVSTASSKTAKRAIPLKYIRKLKELDLTSCPSRRFARDMFLFSFYTRGMSFVDIAHLRRSDLKGGILSYRRKKTGQALTMHWEPCMKEIVSRYASMPESPYLLSIIRHPDRDTRKQCHAALTLINRHLKEIGRSIGLSSPLTMYVARHSWASVAHQEGIPLSVISEGMGHDSEKTTRIYLASLETQVIDKANKKILSKLQ